MTEKKLARITLSIMVCVFFGVMFNIIGPVETLKGIGFAVSMTAILVTFLWALISSA